MLKIKRNEGTQASFTTYSPEGFFLIVHEDDWAWHEDRASKKG